MHLDSRVFYSSCGYWKVDYQYLAHYFKDCFKICVLVFLSLPELAGPSAVEEGKQRFKNIFAIIIMFAMLDDEFCDPALKAPLPYFYLIDVQCTGFDVIRIPS